MEIKFGLISPSQVTSRLLFLVQCRDAANGLHQLQLLSSNWPQGSVQMTTVHGPLDLWMHDNQTRKEPRQGIGEWLAKHRRSMILVGAAITLAGYLLKDVVRDNINNHLTKLNANAAEYRTNLSLLQQRTGELASTTSAIRDNIASLSRDKVALSLAELAYRQELNTNEVFALWKSLPRVQTLNSSEISQLLDGTLKITENQKAFTDHTPSEAPAFQASARSILQQLIELNDRTGKAGAELEVLAFEDSERLEHQSSFSVGASRCCTCADWLSR